MYPEISSAGVDEHGSRRGLWACLGASMTVPGAGGSPFRMNLPATDTSKETTPHLCFDAFCYEPVPFRSAVAEGATHVLALRSRPAGYEPKTKPAFYERAVAPLYFKSNGVPHTVAKFFEQGGQQYLYAEDVLTCDLGLTSTEPIPIPPAKVLYAGPTSESSELFLEKDRSTWARAHLFPITVPADVPELAVLSRDRDDILVGLRHGFATAYDALAPVVGLKTGPDSLDGMRVAELVFPEEEASHESLLEQPSTLPGEKVDNNSRVVSNTNQKDIANDDILALKPRRMTRFRRLLGKAKVFRSAIRADTKATVNASEASIPRSLAVSDDDTILSILPGVQIGSLPLVAERLKKYLENPSYCDSA